MKSRWLNIFEQEQKEKEEAERAAKLARAQQAALEEERNAATLPDGPLAAGAPADRNAVHADRAGNDIRPPQSADHAQSSQPQPSLPSAPQPTAISASDPAEAERQELALAAEANAIAELADSASEGERGVGGSGLADVVVDSPPARGAPGEVLSSAELRLPTHCIHVRIMCHNGLGEISY